MDGLERFVVFRLDQRRYGVRLSHIERVIHAVDFTPVPDAPEIILGVIDVQGTILPLFDVRRRLGFPREISVDDQIIIASTSKRTVALLVDAVDGMVERPREEIVSTEKIVGPLEHVSGLIQLEDGLMLIHDLDTFLSPAEEHALEHALTRKSADGK